jgi:hypothetical protein
MDAITGRNIAAGTAISATKYLARYQAERVVLMRPTVLQTPELAAAYTMEEKSRLPGVRRAEAESLAEEKRQIKSADRALGTKRKAEATKVEAAQPAPQYIDPNRDANGFLIVPE